MISLRTITAIAFGLSALPGLAQHTPDLTARELFYVPGATVAPPSGKRVITAAAKPPASRPATGKQSAPPRIPDDPPVVTVSNPAYEGPRPLGLRYSVLRVTPGQESREVPVDSVFRSGDSVGIALQPNESAYLYIVAKGSSGKWQVMFPNKDMNDGDNWVEGGRRYNLPSNNLAWTFDAQKGTEKIFVVLSRQEVSDLEKLIYDLNQPAKPESAAPGSVPAKTAAPGGKPPAPKKDRPMMMASSIDDALVGRLRSQMLSRDLLVEKVALKEFALYAVEKSGRRDARLVVDVELKHE